MRYHISRKFKAGHYCYNCCLFILLTLIAIFTGATAYLILKGMCCGAGASVSIPAKRDLQKMGEEQIQRILEAIKNVKLAIPDVHAPKVTINDEQFTAKLGELHEQLKELKEFVHEKAKEKIEPLVQQFEVDYERIEKQVK